MALGDLNLGTADRTSGPPKAIKFLSPAAGSLPRFTGNPASPMDVVPPGTFADATAVSSLGARVDDLEAESASFVGGGVILKIKGMPDQYINPVSDDNNARGNALRSACTFASMSPSKACIIEMRPGGYSVNAGQPLTNFATAENVTLSFQEGAWVDYLDPEDAGSDYGMFTSPRNVRTFGATSYNSGDTFPSAGSAGDSLKAFQAANNSLNTLYPEPSPIMLESGRILRTGQIFIPNGAYFLGGTFFWSPTVEIIGESTNATQIFLINGVYNDPGDTEEHFIFKCDPPVSADINNLFYTAIRNLTLGTLGSENNVRASGASILGGQGTQISDCIIGRFYLRNIYGIGCSLIRVWSADATRGPCAHLMGGGNIQGGSFEHCNPDGVENPDIPGTVYPALLLETGIFEVESVIGEEASATPQTTVQCHNVMSAVFGVIAMGVLPGATRNHTLLRVTGTSKNVRAHQLTGLHSGYFLIDPGTLVNDTSDFSPAGAGVPYTLTAAKGTYSQDSGGFVPGLDIPNVFSRDAMFGNPANFTDGLTVRSLLGSVLLYGGSYESTRAVSYFNFANPVPHDWNNGKMNLNMSGDLALAGRLKPVIPSYADDTAADADAGLLPGQLYRTTLGLRTVFQKP